MRHNRIEQEYFKWLYDIVCNGRYIYISYESLLRHLHRIKFTYSIDRDENRAVDGCHLRYRFARYFNYEDCIDDHLYGPCSVLEMLIALAIRCEEDIMDNPDYGDRTSRWFWDMVTNLGLGDMYDERYDDIYVDDVIERFLNREYEPNGKGGLFTIHNCDYDLTKIEIWYQLCWYLDNIV